MDHIEIHSRPNILHAPEFFAHPHRVPIFFKQLQDLGFNLQFETLVVSIWQVVADLWKRKGKVSDSFQTARLLFFNDVRIN